MKKKQKKALFLLICSCFVLLSCVKNLENCKVSPDLERISESALKNKENITETELRSAQIRCNY
jgi:hypothetical protein